MSDPNSSGNADVSTNPHTLSNSDVSSNLDVSSNPDVSNPGTSDGHLIGYTKAQIVSTLTNADVTFTCKVCGECKTTLHEFVQHNVAGECAKTSQCSPESTSDTVVIANSLVAPDDASTLVKVTSCYSPASVDVIKSPAKEVQSEVAPPVRRHTTRCSTGAISRRSVAELCRGWSQKSESMSPVKSTACKRKLDDDAKEVTATTPPRAKRGRPRKIPLLTSVKTEPVDADIETPCTSFSNKISSNDGLKSGGKLINATSNGDAISKDPKVVVEKLIIADSELMIEGKAAEAGTIPDSEEAQNNDSVNPVEKGKVQEEGEEENRTNETAMVPARKLMEEAAETAMLTVEDWVSGDVIDDQHVYAVNMDGDRLEIPEESLDDDPDDPHPVTSAAVRRQRRRSAAGAATRWKRPAPKRSHKFKCSTCKMRYFHTQYEHELHEQCHTHALKNDGDEYACPDCAYTCAGWNRMLVHLLAHPEKRDRLSDASSVRNIVGRFNCPVCGKTFDKKSNMKGHYRKVHFKLSHVCDICGKTLANIDDKTFVRHVEKCQNVVQRCPYCRYCSPVSANMRKHMKIHTGEGFTCEICKNVFPTKQRYAVHVRTHEAHRPRFACEFCGNGFLTQDAVKKHVQRFHEDDGSDRRYPCSICRYVARVEVDLKKHIAGVHNKQYKCTQCAYMTNSSSAFEQHQEYHRPDRIYPCNAEADCFYRGATPKQLADHISQVHKVGSKHQCPICNKYYKKKTHLLRHLVSHTNQLPYACNECGQRFNNHSSYYRHRSKLGHDQHRPSGTVVSVPQNITIQYLEMPSMPGEGDGETGTEPSQEAFMEEVACAERSLKVELDTQGEGTSRTAMNGGQEVRLIHKPELIDGTVSLEPISVQEEEEVRSEVENAMQSTVQYVVKFDEDSENFQVCTTEVDNGVASELNVVPSAGGDASGEVQAFVEVAPPGGGEASDEQQYAIVLCMSGDEPEAALSMLQLQSATQ